MEEIFAIIMAGGRGERFWPISRNTTPKQFSKILGNTTLLESTLARVSYIVPTENIIIMTNEIYVDKVKKILPQFPTENIIGEPCARDTAPCIALAAGIIKKRAKSANPTMVILPSDHWIKDEQSLRKDLLKAIELANKNSALATIGIKPYANLPDYGYIEIKENLAGETLAFSVNRFTEKPTEEKAAEFIATGRFYWNSGMFIFPNNLILEEFKRQAPRLYQFAISISESLDFSDLSKLICEQYETLMKISIDYCIMENAKKVIMLEANFDWDDIGNWKALKNHLPLDAAGNISKGVTQLNDCNNCIILNYDSHLVATIGLSDIIVINTGDATLVCPSNQGHKIKNLLANFKDENLEKYL